MFWEPPPDDPGWLGVLDRPALVDPGGTAGEIPVAEGLWIEDGFAERPGGDEEPSLMAALQAAVTRLLLVDPSALDGELALSELSVLLGLQSQLKLVELQRVADVDRRALGKLEGAPTTSAWLQSRDSDVDRREVALAKKLSGLPLVAREIAGGRLSIRSGTRLQTALSMLRHRVDRPDGLIDGQPSEGVLETVLLETLPQLVAQALGGLAQDDPRLLDVLARCRAIVTRGDDGEAGDSASELSRLEAAFVLLAGELEPSQLTGALGLLIAALLPGKLEADAARAADRRGLRLTSRGDGRGWRVDGDLDLETGELLWAFLDAELRRDPDNPVDTSSAQRMREAGLDPADADDRESLPSREVPRSRDVRQHDALRNGLTRYLGAGLGGVCDKVPLHIGVTIGLERLAGVPGTLPGRGTSGALLPLSLVRKWWCAASVSRFVMGLGRLVVETSHTRRTTTAAERRAKLLQTGGRCQCAGCPADRSIPGTVLTPHHPTAWARSGRTSYHDTVLLCPASHRDVHERGLTIRLRDGRYLNEKGWAEGPSGQL